jgi:hypothetical protein
MLLRIVHGILGFAASALIAVSAKIFGQNCRASSEPNHIGNFEKEVHYASCDGHLSAARI